MRHNAALRCFPVSLLRSNGSAAGADGGVAPTSGSGKADGACSSAAHDTPWEEELSGELGRGLLAIRMAAVGGSSDCTAKLPASLASIA